MPQTESYLAALGSTKTQLAWHQPVPTVFGLLCRCEAPGCWYLGGPEGCMTRRQNLTEYLALADDAELARALAADYLFTYAEARQIRNTLSARTRPVPSRPTSRATVRAHRVQPVTGVVPAPSPSRALEVIGS